MKKALEWYQQLPEPIRSEAIANSNSLDRMYSSLPQCLIGNFRWINTPQGQGIDYWFDIVARARNGEFDKPTQNLHGWIPVGERLPTKKDADMEGVVLAINFMNQQRVYHYTIVRKKNRGIQFWQPLPKLPEVQDGNN